MERHVFFICKSALGIKSANQAVGKHLKAVVLSVGQQLHFCRRTWTFLIWGEDFPSLDLWSTLDNNILDNNIFCAWDKEANWMSETGSGYVSFNLTTLSQKIAPLKGRRMWREEGVRCVRGKRATIPHLHEVPLGAFHWRKKSSSTPSFSCCLSSHVRTRCPQSAVKPESQRKMVSEEHLILLNYFHYFIVNLATKWVCNRSQRL